MTMDSHAAAHGDIPPVAIALRALPERTLVRAAGSRRNIAFTLLVGPADPASLAQRTPLDLALVIDRSGSMAGEPLIMAVQAAQSIISNLTERDRAAVIVFDDHSDVLNPMINMSLQAKEQARAALARVHPGGSTNLYDGWLTGCRAIASEDSDGIGKTLAHCFLLTDGQANQGITDQEEIAATAAQLRSTAGISTSTFGFGTQYEEMLLGAMAAAGGGQFHHVRSGLEIGDTFSGELTNLFRVAARHVRLEIALPTDVTAQIVSTYRQIPSADPQEPVVVDIGDLSHSEARAVVVRFQFPSKDLAYMYTIRSRVRWLDGANEHVSPWSETTFKQGSTADCNAEPFAMDAMHHIGLAYAAWVRQEAVAMSYQGLFTEAAALVRTVRHRIKQYADGDLELLVAIEQLREVQSTLERGPLSSMHSKEMYFQAQRSSRGQQDYRQRRPPTE